MRTEKFYFCDVCGAKYEKESEAQKCEKKHKKSEKQEMPVMLSIQEASNLTRQSYWFIRKLCQEKKIKYLKNGRKYLINEKSLINYFNGETGEA